MQLAFPQIRGLSDRSAQMRIRTLVIALALAAPLVALESGPAAACDWLWGRGSSYGYAPASYSGYAPRSYGYSCYAPAYYGGYGFYGRRWGLRGYGYRGWRGYGFRSGWRGYGYRGWQGARVAGFRGARVAGFRGGVRGGFRGGFGRR
jgi:hypothetical protein